MKNNLKTITTIFMKFYVTLSKFNNTYARFGLNFHINSWIVRFFTKENH